jgi:hypothetical protein
MVDFVSSAGAAAPPAAVVVVEHTISIRLLLLISRHAHVRRGALSASFLCFP